MGKHIEHYHRTIGFDAILGGGACRPYVNRFLPCVPSHSHWRLFIDLLAEDVLGDLGVRQAMKKIPKNVRL